MTHLDWGIVALYLAGVVGIGLWAGRHGRTTVEYLLGGRSIPSWAAAISILASEVSAATFIGVPAMAFAGDCTYLQFAIGTLLARIVLAYVLVDVYYRLGVYTVYEFLTSRFDQPTRYAAAGVFLFARLLASGVRLFIGALPLVTILHLDKGPAGVNQAIVILGSAAMLYTVFGGIKAVIWTDVVQASIYMVAAATTIGVVVWHLMNLDGDGLARAGELIEANGRARIFDFSTFSFGAKSHFFAALAGGFFLTMATHGTDQDMVQRMLTCRTSREGRRSLITSGLLDFPIVITFLGVGVALFAFYELVPVGYEKPFKDQVFPTFIERELPIGVKGLVIAGLCAAVMASLSTAINALATTTVIDFYKRDRTDVSDAQALRASRIATVVWSMLLMGVAVLSAYLRDANPNHSLIDLALGVMTLVYGSLLGVFMLGIFTKRRGRAATNIAGMFTSVVIVSFLSMRRTIDGWFVGADIDLGASWRSFVAFEIAWPWYIVIGTFLTIGIAALGVTRRGRDDVLAPLTRS